MDWGSLRTKELSEADVFLTGGTGFIGKHFLKRFQKAGRNVRCLVRKTSSIESIRQFDCEVVNGNLNDVDSLAKAVANCKTVFHVAGKARNVTRGDLHQTNCEGTRNLALACLKQPNPPTLIFISSLAAAGPSKLNQPLVESDRCRPVSKYGKSKLDAESALRDLSSSVAVSVLRPPIVFGEEDTVTLDMFTSIQRFRVSATPGFMQKQYSLIHADDLVESALTIEDSGQRLQSGDRPKGIYFAAYPENLSGKKFAQAIGRSIARQPLIVPVPHVMVKLIAATNEVISTVTPWKPFVNWDKAREVTAGSWTCDAAKLLGETSIQYESLDVRLAQTVEGYRRKGWL